MLLVLISAWSTEALGIHALLGAFVTGLVMPKGAKKEQVFKRRLDSVTVVLFLPLFFAYNASAQVSGYCIMRRFGFYVALSCS